MTDPDHPEIRDTEEGPLVPSEHPKTQPTFAIWLAVAAVIICIGVGFICWRAWGARPAVRARRRLRQLRHREAGFAELMHVLREYLDQRLGLGARFCSSTELITALEARSLGFGSTRQVLCDFLNACDHGRFGRGVSPPATYKDTLENCDTLIECLDFDIGRRERAGA